MTLARVGCHFTLLVHFTLCSLGEILKCKLVFSYSSLSGPAIFLLFFIIIFFSFPIGFVLDQHASSNFLLLLLFPQVGEVKYLSELNSALHKTLSFS